VRNGLGSSGSGQAPMAGSFEFFYDNETSRSIKGGKILDYVTNY
jgi:hypothetical protein